MKTGIALAGLLLLCFATTAFAHRVDEYLQAAMLNLAGDRVEINLRLTPGIEVLGKVTEEAAALPQGTSLFERSIYPLATPGIAGPGAMLTVVLLTDNNTRSLKEQALTTVELAICLAILLGIYAMASFLYRVLGRGGIEVVSRVFGLVVCSIAIHNMIIAIKLSFHLAA